MKPILDLSYYQKPEAIDYDLIASQVDGVILRAAYGTGAAGKFDGADPSFAKHYAELHKRGVPLGAYHYITEYQPIDAQAKLFIDTVRGLDLKLGYWCDVELEQYAERLTASSVIRWMELVEGALGECGIYTGRWCWRDIMGDLYNRYQSRNLWMSAYVQDYTKYIPHGWEKPVLWQYTSSARMDGYTGNLDANKFMGTDAEYQGWLGGRMLLNIEPLSQVDPKWRSEKLGTSNTTIGGYGCLITCAAMMLRHFGYDTDPSRLNKLLIANGGYHEGNLFVWNSLKVFYPPVTFGYRYDYAALDKIDEQLAAGRPAIIQVDFVPSTSAIDEHWVLVVGKVGGSYIINDPKDGKQLKFEDRYGDPKSKIYHVCTYNFSGAVAPAEPETPLYRVRIKAGVTSLIIRSAPIITASTDTGKKAKYPEEYDIFEEKNGYGRIGASRWISLAYTERVTVEPILSLEQRVTALEKAVFGG